MIKKISLFLKLDKILSILPNNYYGQILFIKFQELDNKKQLKSLNNFQHIKVL